MFWHQTYGAQVLFLLLFGWFCCLESGTILYGLGKKIIALDLQIFNRQNIGFFKKSQHLVYS